MTWRRFSQMDPSFLQENNINAGNVDMQALRGALDSISPSKKKYSEMISRLEENSIVCQLGRNLLSISRAPNEQELQDNPLIFAKYLMGTSTYSCTDEEVLCNYNSFIPVWDVETASCSRTHPIISPPSCSALVLAYQISVLVDNLSRVKFQYYIATNFRPVERRSDKKIKEDRITIETLKSEVKAKIQRIQKELLDVIDIRKQIEQLQYETDVEERLYNYNSELQYEKAVEVMYSRAKQDAINNRKRNGPSVEYIPKITKPRL